jgi:hypothetical protein
MPANSLPPSAPHRYAFAATLTPMILRKTMASPNRQLSSELVAKEAVKEVEAHRPAPGDKLWQ